MCDIALCGNETIDCIDCCGNGVCIYTKTDDTVLTDSEQIINDAMIQALKDTMDVKLKSDFKITYEDFEKDEGLQTMILKAGDTIPVCLVTEDLVKNFEYCFEGLLGKWLVDWDKLAPSMTSIVESVEDLIIDEKDYEIKLDK